MKKKIYFKNKHNYNTVISKLKKKENYNFGQNIYEVFFMERYLFTNIAIPSSKQNSDEAKGAKFLGQTIGGEIIVREEYNKDYFIPSTSNPDYLVNGKFWDLKTIEFSSKEEAIKRGIKAKAHQIKNNPGGILLDVSKTSIPTHIVKKQIISGMKDTSICNFKVIAERKSYIIAAFKKK